MALESGIRHLQVPKKEVNHIMWLSRDKERRGESDNLTHLLALQLSQVTRRPALRLMTRSLLPSFN